MDVGEQFGRWTIVDLAEPRTYERSRGGAPHVVAHFRCECICGTQREVSALSLKSGRSTSCGCGQADASKLRHMRHGGASDRKSTPEYTAFRAMIARCENPNNPRYADYGGRGIFVSGEWRTDFAKFLAHIGPRPSPRHSIDRINNERHYEPGNVRWTLPHNQMTNRRNSRFVDVEGAKVALSDLASRSGIPANTLRWRLLKGWGLAKAIGTPVRHKAKAGQR